uniref:non-specific serine/threonine protein kinase n=2 Tax=Brassica campestris TaxID=3711 RepID=M4DXK7_BRACM
MMGFSMYLFVLLPQLFLRFGLAENPSGFTSLTCGAPMGTSFLEKATNITYSSDAPYIDTGIGRSIKSSYQSKSEQQTWYLRSFPQSSRSCYTFNMTTGDKYLIRAIFFHGGYDTRPSTKFDLHLGPNKWATVSTAEETKSETFEIIHILATSRLQVCLVKTEDSTPFISAIELRKLTSKAYANESGSLQTFLRADIGSFSKQSLRYGSGVYGADVFDRIWLPYNSENWSQIRTDNSVDNDNGFKVPENVMATASVPTDPDAHMNISLTGLHQTSRFYVCLHFSEIQELNPNDTRELKVMYNGRLIIEPFKPISFYTRSFFRDELGPNANGQCTFSLQKTASSTLPPLLNAMEVYMVNSLSQNETDTKEVDTMINIKLSCGINKVDPCVPRDYMWSGVNCSYIDSEQPKIISFDFSNNSLIGPVPEFLAHMTSLKVIIEGNPGICSSASCATTNKKKTKKKTMVIASVAASIFLILVIVLVILKRRAKLGRYPSSDHDDNNLQQCNNQSSSSEMANNMFTYEDLAQATDNFSNVNFIGQGGFGYVHKGVLPDGTEVAIKQLKAGSGQGEREFRAEIEIISRVHHRHLVSLLGYCVIGTQRLLVYEFLPNKTLEFHLHEKRRPLDWSKRMKIASGAARGLAYLHEDCNPKTIHRDVKAANVLIDDSYEAKCTFSLQKTASSTLPPLLNAMEVYMVNSLSQNETDTKEVDTMINIKLSCGINKVDPCVPRDYMWSGVNCSYIDSEQPKIISFDFSNNSLIGPVPEFLAHMTSLKVIIEGNPGICSSASCATTNKKKTKKKTMVIASVAASIFLILVIVLVILKRRAKLGRYPSSDHDDNNLQQCNNQSSSSEMANNMFTYEDLAQATDNFSNVNFIGQGGFGYVHKGVLPDGTEVAIKQLKAGSGQGEREFRAEIEIISRVHHRHLVSLLGYCVIGTQRLLVYEFLPNKTLEFHLHEKRRPLDWSKRMKIASGAARGLAYLHEDCNPKTIHRDVKAANVLIDDSYEAKLADEENIVDWAKPLMLQALNTGNYHGLVDPRLEKDFDISQIKRMVLCADACVQHSAKHRPKMSQPLGDITSYNLDGSSDYTSTEYKEDVKKFKRLVLESQTFGSSDLTSDNAQSSSGSFCIKSET